MSALLGGTELLAQHAGTGAVTTLGRTGGASHVSGPASHPNSPSTGPRRTQPAIQTGHWPSWNYNSRAYHSKAPPLQPAPYVFPELLSFGYGLPLGIGYAGDDATGDTPLSNADGPPSAEEAANGQPPDRPLYRPPYQGSGGAFAEAPTAPAAPVRPQPTTILIFKDGRARQQVHNYAVLGSTLWALDGENRQEIPLQALDIPATVKANGEAGVDFALPSSR